MAHKQIHEIKKPAIAPFIAAMLEYRLLTKAQRDPQPLVSVTLNNGNRVIKGELLGLDNFGLSLWVKNARQGYYKHVYYDTINLEAMYCIETVLKDR